MNLGSVMQEIADRLDTIDGLRAYPYPLDGTPAVPAAIVTYPDRYVFDETYGRGMDRMELPVVVLVGRVYDRVARDQIARYLGGGAAPLNPNPHFETDIAGWTGQGGTLDHSTDQAHTGAGSALLTPNGVASIVLGQVADTNDFSAVTAGRPYRASGWFFSQNSLAQVSIAVSWFDAALGSLGTGNSAITALPNGVWTEYAFEQVAPANAVKAQLRARIHGTPTISQTMYLDDMRFTANDGGSSIKTVLESGTYVSFDTVRVMSVEFDVVRTGTVDYLAATLTLDIAGQGAP